MGESRPLLVDLVVEALALELRKAQEVVRGTKSLRRELGMDSIGAINVAFALEEQLGIEIDVVRGEAFDSVDDIVLIVERNISAARG